MHEPLLRGARQDWLGLFQRRGGGGLVAAAALKG